MRVFSKRIACAVLLAGLANVTAACSDSPGLPTGPTTITVVVQNLLARGGATSRSFRVVNSGQVTLTLTSLEQDVEIGIALGASNSTTGECSRDFTEVTSVTGAKTIERRFEPGEYCATFYDVGNLTISSRFTATIAHP